MKDNSTTRIEMLKAYIADEPADPFTQYALALEYIRLNKENEATSLLENVLNNHPDYLPSYYQLGKLYEKSSNLKEALKIYADGITLARSQQDFHTLSELQNAYDMLNF